ncbi:MAG: hypothetical protein GY847_12545 [Proteobacteria bacterium]|nr:hypothetical protein [Pseudomonadota bacterium]
MKNSRMGEILTTNFKRRKNCLCRQSYYLTIDRTVGVFDCYISENSYSQNAGQVGGWAVGQSGVWRANEMGNAHALTEWITDRLIAECDNGAVGMSSEKQTNYECLANENDKFFRTTHAHLHRIRKNIRCKLEKI